jgi:hypothetical protein
MENSFLEKFKVNGELIFNNKTFEVVNKRETESFYDLKGKDSAGKQLEISLKNKLNDEVEDFFLVFIDNEKIVYNKRKQKLNTNLNKTFLKLLSSSEEGDKIEFEGNIYELKNIVRSEIKEDSNIYPSVNYILVSYINDKEKLSLSIFDCNSVLSLNSCEIKYVLRI